MKYKIARRHKHHPPQCVPKWSIHPSKTRPFRAKGRWHAAARWHFSPTLHNNPPPWPTWINSMQRVLLTALALLAVSAHTHGAQAQRPLDDPEAFLAEHGVSGELQAAWVERAQTAEDRYVYGFRVATATGANDLYFDAATGASLGPMDQIALGIYPKPLAQPEIAIESERVEAGPAPTPIPKHAFTNALPEIILPPVDRARLLAEDADRAGLARGPLRLGVAEDLPEPLTYEGLGASGAKSAGSTRGIALRAPGALGLRVHIRFDVPAAIRVYAPSRPAETYTPAPGVTTWWSPTCWDEAVHIEADAPGFVIDRVVQVYRLPGDGLDKRAGSCELDVTCYDGWSDQALGVGGIGTIAYDEFIFCTASLLVDSDPESNIPYLLTGNHCVKNNSEADPLEVYWQYQTPYCGGPIPDLANVPRTTGGATFLAGNSNYFGTDLSLLRLRQQPPAGLVWLGWETASPALGAEVVCIHHPDGDFKRISFGEIVDSGIGRLRPASRYHEVQWYAGVTEPGSSGSPLMLASTQRLIGQLYGGSSACSAPLDSDYYGRFDVSYLFAQRFLGFIQNPFDVTGDHVVNAADLQQVVNASLARPASRKEDLNGDGRVTAIDIQSMVLAVLSFSG